MEEPKKEDFTTVVGVMPGIQPGELVRCKGKWKHHPRFGQQFTVESFELDFATFWARLPRLFALGRSTYGRT